MELLSDINLIELNLSKNRIISMEILEKLNLINLQRLYFSYEMRKWRGSALCSAHHLYPHIPHQIPQAPNRQMQEYEVPPAP